MPYPGGKGGAGVYQTIINGMPRHEVYVEPFLGGGAVMAAKRPACLNIGVDLDAEVIAQAGADQAYDGAVGQPATGYADIAKASALSGLGASRQRRRPVSSRMPVRALSPELASLQHVQM